MAEAGQNKGLASRMGEAKEAAANIKKGMDNDHHVAAAGAELAAAGVRAGIAVTGLKQRLNDDLANAEDADAVNALLKTAEQDAGLLQEKYAGIIGDIMKRPGISDKDRNGKLTTAGSLAKNLRNAVKRDI